MANETLSTVTSSVVRHLDSFSAWTIGGSAAFGVILVFQAKDISDILPKESCIKAAIWVFASIVSAATARYLAAVIAAWKEANDKLEQWVEKRKPFDAEAYMRTLVKAFPRPLNRIVTRSFRQARKGDITYIGKSFAKWGLIHGVLITLQMLCLMGAVVIILWGIR